MKNRDIKTAVNTLHGTDANCPVRQFFASFGPLCLLGLNINTDLPPPPTLQTISILLHYTKYSRHSPMLRARASSCPMAFYVGYFYFHTFRCYSQTFIHVAVWTMDCYILEGRDLSNAYTIPLNYAIFLGKPDLSISRHVAKCN